MPGTEVRTMHSGVTTGTPATAESQLAAVFFASDENLARSALHLRVTLEAEVVVRLDEQLRIYRAVGTVADDATFAQRFVFENERLRLVAVAGSARLVQSRECKAAGGFHDVHAMGIMALHAVHFPFLHGMMLRQIELGVRFEMTLETGGGVLAGIQDESAAPAAGFDVLAPGAMTGLATTVAGPGIGREVHPRVRAGGKLLDIIGMTRQAGLIADELGPGNVCRHDHRSGNTGTGVGHHQHRKPRKHDDQSGPPSRPLAGQIHAYPWHATPLVCVNPVVNDFDQPPVREVLITIQRTNRHDADAMHRRNRGCGERW